MNDIEKLILAEESRHRFLSALFKKNIKADVLKSERLVAFTLHSLKHKDVTEKLTLSLLKSENNKLMSLSEGSKEYNLAEGVGSFYALLRNENLHPTIPIHYNNYIGRGDISIRSFLKGYKTADQLSDDFLALAKELLIEINDRSISQ